MINATEGGAQVPSWAVNQTWYTSHHIDINHGDKEDKEEEVGKRWRRTKRRARGRGGRGRGRGGGAEGRGQRGMGGTVDLRRTWAKEVMGSWRNELGDDYVGIGSSVLVVKFRRRHELCGFWWWAFIKIMVLFNFRMEWEVAVEKRNHWRVDDTQGWNEDGRSDGEEGARCRFFFYSTNHHGIMIYYIWTSCSVYFREFVVLIFLCMLRFFFLVNVLIPRIHLCSRKWRLKVALNSWVCCWLTE